MEHYNLVIATPGHAMSWGYVQSLTKTIKVLEEKGITWTYRSGTSSAVHWARELTLTDDDEVNNPNPFEGKFTYDKILCIDSDISWEPEDALSVYHSDKDIVGGCYTSSAGYVVVFPEKLGQPPMPADVRNMQGLQKVWAIGFGFVCIKSGVFEAIERPWFQLMSIERFDGKSMQIPGEDLSFCDRAAAMGFEVWLDPSVRLVHWKELPLRMFPPSLYTNR